MLARSLSCVGGRELPARVERGTARCPCWSSAARSPEVGVRRKQGRASQFNGRLDRARPRRGAEHRSACTARRVAGGATGLGHTRPTGPDGWHQNSAVTPRCVFAGQWACARRASNRQARTLSATIGPWRRQRLLTSLTISTARRTQPRLRFHSMVSTTRSTCRRRMLLRWRRLSSRTSMRLPRSAVEAHVRDARGVLGHRGRARISPPFVNGRAGKALRCPIEVGFPPLSSSSTTPSTSICVSPVIAALSGSGSAVGESSRHLSSVGIILTYPRVRTSRPWSRMTGQALPAAPERTQTCVIGIRSVYAPLSKPSGAMTWHPRSGGPGRGRPRSGL